ncbi:MAG: twin-arginine translocation signal domain-containing protein [Myxococcales bacterium]|nr:MAG: twin-arginine translocation signal domain-containing protein [Myxococcales bacterium]
MSQNKTNLNSREAPSLSRRDLLKTGAALGAAAAVGTSCTSFEAAARLHNLVQSSDVDEDDLRAYLAWLDRSVQGFESMSPISDSTWRRKARPKGPLEEFAYADYLTRDALAALTFTGLFGPLPDKAKQHPESRQRLAAMAPTLDRAYFKTAAFLNSRTPEELEEVRKFLKENPDMEGELVAFFETEAKELKVPFSRRASMRTMISNSCWRLKNQNPKLLVSECVEAVRKAAVAAHQENEFHAYLASEGASIPTPTDAEPREEPKASQVPGIPDAPEFPENQESEEPQKQDMSGLLKKIREPEKDRPRKPEGFFDRTTPSGMLNTAGVVLSGLGAATLIGSGIAFAVTGAFGPLFGLTVGGILVLVGLIVLIVGLVKRKHELEE